MKELENEVPVTTQSLAGRRFEGEIKETRDSERCPEQKAKSK